MSKVINISEARSSVKAQAYEYNHRAARLDLIQSLDIAAKWLSLPAVRREQVKRIICAEVQAARESGEKSLLYLDSGGHCNSIEDPYININLMTRYAELAHDGKCTAGAGIIEEHRNSVTGNVATYWVERWIDSLLINQRYMHGYERDISQRMSTSTIHTANKQR